MGTDIDTIFKMLSWNSSEKEQLRGIDEAKKIEYLSVLFQPIEDKSVSESFWEGVKFPGFVPPYL